MYWWLSAPAIRCRSAGNPSTRIRSVIIRVFLAARRFGDAARVLVRESGARSLLHPAVLASDDERCNDVASSAVSSDGTVEPLELEGSPSCCAPPGGAAGSREPDKTRDARRIRGRASWERVPGVVVEKRYLRRWFVRLFCQPLQQPVLWAAYPRAEGRSAPMPANFAKNSDGSIMDSRVDKIDA